MHLIFLCCEMGHSKVLKDLPKKSFKLSVFAVVIILKLLIFLILIIGPFRLFNFFQEIFVNLYFSTNIHFNEILNFFFYHNYISWSYYFFYLYYFILLIFSFLFLFACMFSHFSCVWLFETPWTVAHQASLSMGFSQQEYWSGLPCSPPGDLSDPGIKLTPHISPALAGRFFTIAPPGKPQIIL